MFDTINKACALMIIINTYQLISLCTIIHINASKDNYYLKRYFMSVDFVWDVGAGRVAVPAGAQ